MSLTSMQSKFFVSADERGILSAFSFQEFFQIKRFFHIICKKDVWRGKHYHKKGTQLICLLKGSLDANIIRQNSFEKVTLKEGDVFLQEVGCQFEFKANEENTTLLVLCDSDHDESDYFTYERKSA